MPIQHRYTHWRRSLTVAAVCALAALAWAGGGGPARGVAAAEQHLLYVALDGGVNVYDIDNGHTLVRRISLDASGPRGIQASVRNQILYIAYLHTKVDAALVALDLRTDELLWERHYPGADALVITPDGDTIFMSSGEGAARDYFYVIDAHTGAQRDVIHVHEGTHNTVMSLDGAQVFLSSLKYPYLVRADPRTDAAIGQVGPFGAGIRPFTVNGRGSLAFVNVNGLQGFEVGDTASGRVIARVAVQGYPYRAQEDPSHGIGMTPDEREIWVAGGSNYVHVFDATKMPPVQVASVKLRRQPKWISMSIDGRYIYPGSGDVVEAATRKVVATYPYSKRQLEVDFAGGAAVRAGDMYARGQITGGPPATATATRAPQPSPTATPTSPAGAPGPGVYLPQISR